MVTILIKVNKISEILLVIYRVNKRKFRCQLKWSEIRLVLDL